MRDNNTSAAGSLLGLNTITHAKCLVDCISLPSQEKKVIITILIIIIEGHGERTQEEQRKTFGRKVVMTGLPANETAGSSLLCRLSELPPQSFYYKVDNLSTASVKENCNNCNCNHRIQKTGVILVKIQAWS